MTIGKAVIATKRGTCAICRGTIWEGNDQELGDEIVQVDGAWCHAVCVPELEEAA